MLPVAKNTSIIFLHQTRTRSQIIYSVTLLAILIALVSLPFIYTTVSVKGSGALQSNVERAELFAPVAGKISFINIKDNQKVNKGEVLLSIDATLPTQQNQLLHSRTTQLQQQLSDAEHCLGVTSTAKGPVLQTGLYLASWQQFAAQTQNALNAKLQAETIYKRYDILYSKKVVTLAEYEQYKFNYEQAVSDFNMILKKYKTQWQTEANQYRNELKDIQNQKLQITEQQKLYTIKAGIAGTLQNLTGLQRGVFIGANQKIGEISPDSALLAFCYLSPANIGLIKKGQAVRLQVDAFNYNQWGMLTAKVVDIAEDIVLINQNPYFKVKCKLDKNYLELKNGYKGQVKKGMTFNARFTITKRSLYQLLYDNVDDWLNPIGGGR